MAGASPPIARCTCSRPSATGTARATRLSQRYAVGRIGLSICYDFMFPEFIRRLVDDGAEIVINSTNWISNDFQRGMG